MDSFAFSGYGLVYTLELEDDCFYIGWTNNLNTRLFQHFNGEGSKWTKAHKPIKLINVIIGGKSEESEETLRLMYIHGRDKVRGGAYTKQHINFIQKFDC
jgi:hypothetical protein